jgi:outer membrane lipoprotein-sorting protein
MKLLLAIAFSATLAAQTAEELVQRNLQAKGGVDKIKSIQTLRMTGKLQSGSFTAQIGRDAAAPNEVRQTFTVQGMTAIQAYDGSTGWQISPFEGRKDPELLGEEELRGIVEDADFYGALVDYQAKGNTIEYLGHDTVDGDDAHRLKVTLKNGDIYYYYLDPETFLEIRVEKVQFVRGSVRETFSEPGSYKLVNGIYFPFSVESGSKQNPGQRAKITFDKIEANVKIDPNEFKMPATASGSGSQKELEQ